MQNPCQWDIIMTFKTTMTKKLEAIEAFWKYLTNSFAYV